MTGSEWLVILAVILAALAVLPGTLGILMLTNRIAVSEPGARYIYGKSFWVLIASAVLLAAGIWRAFAEGGLESWIFRLSVLAYLGILVFGFFMHTKLMFRPVRKPKFLSAEEAVAKFGPDEEVVGVLDPDGTPFAFIARLARRPHIVYQTAGAHPFIMTHCILAHSSMAYALEDRFREPRISITAALANNMVFYDKSSQCSVIQLHNRSLDGSMPLKTMPTIACSLGTWRRLYPQSKVWYRDIEWRDIFYLKLLARADVIDPTSPMVVYPLQHEKDTRRPLKEQVLGVEIDGAVRTYPLPVCRERRLIEDELGGTPLLIVSDAEGDYVQVFDRRVDGEALHFTLDEAGEGLRDSGSGSLWTLTGACVEGAHKGRSLRPVPHYNKIFWYVWSDFHPGTEIYGEATDHASAA
ncbi:MAG: DUF3179 domain-containing protein [Alphaproteobacteria bacterium]|nr:MAG: DUF3179 domain-containing protein [Alphaproteobacteria bacterium]